VHRDRDLLDTISPPEAHFLFEQLKFRLARRGNIRDLERISRAFDRATKQHVGMFRDGGQPYITHPVEVAEICAALNMDEDSLVTALLHDVVEDTSGYSLSDIEREFGKEVREMVDSLTKISDANFFVKLWSRRETPRQAENLRKLFVAMAKDPRVIVIKLADRLHNLRTLEGLDPKRIERQCRETEEFFIPLARRLGLASIYREMEDWCFRYLEPEEYRALEEDVLEPMLEAERILGAMQERLEDAFWRANIPIAEIHSRRKHLASLRAKMLEKGVSIDEVYDLLAMRIVVDGAPGLCYQVLGEVHMVYPPLEHRFRDFIARPKANGYQTLHTTVVGPGGRFVEVQIRTVEMHHRAQYGIASHWLYKEGPEEYAFNKDEEWSELIRMLEDERVDSQEFVARAQTALLKGMVLTLTPKGEVVSLPKGSCPIDFAYAIHTDLGHATGGAKVNGTRVPLYHRLENGDVVEIIKRDSLNAAPDAEWMDWVKSPRTLLKIRKWFKAQPRRKRIDFGRQLLHKEIQKRGLYPLNLLAPDKLVAILKLLKVGSIYDIYDRLACGDLTTSEILLMLKQVQMERAQKVEMQEVSAEPSLAIPLIAPGAELGVLDTRGKRTRQKTELAACCRPIPGDSIVGYYDRDSKRIVVHTQNCAKLGALGEKQEISQLSWDKTAEGKRYPVHIEVVSLNRAGLMYDVLGVLAAGQVNLTGGHFEIKPSTTGAYDDPANTQVLIEIGDTTELERVLAEIRNVPDVIAAFRLGGSDRQPEEKSGKPEPAEPKKPDKPKKRLVQRKDSAETVGETVK